MNKVRIRNTHKSASNRQLKVSESIKRSLSEVLNIDKSLAFIIGDQTFTISQVDISPDLKNAKIYIIPFGLQDSEDLIDILNENASLIKKYLIKKVVLKYAPELRFFYDNSFDAAARVTDLLTDNR